MKFNGSVLLMCLFQNQNQSYTAYRTDNKLSLCLHRIGINLKRKKTRYQNVHTSSSSMITIRALYTEKNSSSIDLKFTENQDQENENIQNPSRDVANGVMKIDRKKTPHEIQIDGNKFSFPLLRLKIDIHIKRIRNDWRSELNSNWKQKCL